MTACCICKADLRSPCVICRDCFAAWPKGMGFGEYCKKPYKPDPVVIPPGVGTAEDFPE